MSATVDEFAVLARNEEGLAVVSTLRADQSIQCSLVNVGVLAHPLIGDAVLDFVTYGWVKLANLRERPLLTATVQSEWDRDSVEGSTAARGIHDDWSTYDRVMLEPRRAVVFVTPQRVYSNAN